MGRIPFDEIPNDYQVISNILSGKKLSRPSAEDCLRFGLNDKIWQLLAVCWETIPVERPTASQIVAVLRSIGARPSRSDAWDDSFLKNVRFSLDDHPISPLPGNVDATTVLTRASLAFKVSLRYTQHWKYVMADLSGHRYQVYFQQ